ncbi:MAG: hypothetical protein DWQ10_03610, partial [Calditrichaeota bacterium]
MKNIKFRTIIEMALFLLALFLLFLLLMKSGVGKPETLSDKVLFFGGLLLAIFGVLGIHEAGHLFTGMLQGFEFQLFVIGSLGIKKEDGRVQPYFNTDISYFGGVAVTAPVREDTENANKFSRIIIAGPIASFLFGLICLAVSLALAGLYASFVFITGVISLAIFFATTIPTKTGVFFSDRKRYQRLKTAGDEQQVELAMLRVLGRYAQHNSYVVIDEDDLNILMNDREPFIQYYGLVCHLCRQYESGGVADS